MKKTISFINEYLSHFWLTMLLLIVGSFCVIFFTPSPVITELSINGHFSSISSVVSSYFFLFFLPFGGLSLFITLFVWLRKNEKSYNGFISSLFVILTIGLMFLLILKLVNIDYDIRNGGIFKSYINQVDTIKKEIHPSLEELEAIENSSIDKSDWQTYKNDYYKFEIKVPKSWNIKRIGSSDDFDNSNITDPSMVSYLAFQPTINDCFFAPLNMYVEKNEDNLLIKDWFLKKYQSYNIDVDGFISINIPTTEEAAVMSVEFIDNDVIYSYYIRHNNKMFSFNMSDSGSDVKNGSAMMNAIIKTIRFK